MIFETSLAKIVFRVSLVVIAFLTLPTQLHGFTPSDTYLIGSYYRATPKIKGNQAYLTTPQTGEYYQNPRYSIIYTGTQGNSSLVESGAVETAGLQYFPRAAWKDTNGNHHDFFDTSSPLYPGGWYFYDLHHLGNGVWRAQWQDGNLTWHTIKDITLGIGGMQNTGAGAYSYGCCSHFNSVHTSNNVWIRTDGTYRPYCYSTVLQFTPPGASITPCGSNRDWTVTY